jgi:ribonuclease HI
MTKSTLAPITIYTDGACNPNPGPGGWAAILLRPDNEPQELSVASPQTTNNQMEMQAVLSALKSLPGPHHITLYTDSKYLKQGLTEWLPGWQQRGWRTSSKEAVKNQALWQALAAEIGHHQIEWKWVKGHAGNRWNERADELARSMLPETTLPLDDETAIHIFTAASYLGKQKSGGWGVVLRYQNHLKTLNGSERNTSANRMHLLAAINGLEAVKKSLPIHLYTAADYVRDGITKWVNAWQRQQWQTKSGKPVSHRELWEHLLPLTETHEVQWHLATKEHQPETMLEAKNLADAAARR